MAQKHDEAAVEDGERRIRALDPERARAWLDDLVGAARERSDGGLVDRLREGSSRVESIAAVLDLSTYLNSLAQQHPEWLEPLLGDARAAIAERIIGRIDELNVLPTPDQAEPALMTRLRQIKREVSLLLAMRDILGLAGPQETTGDLSALAEAAVRAAVRFCLADLHRRGKLKLPHPEDPERRSGFFVLGMGKLGARELNYSSDVDLIVFFEETAGIFPEPMEAVDVLSKLVRRLVRIIGERTADGYVFRTDLRLRPDPSAMPLAISTDAALTYYEGSGRNWERAAMIKARCIAGDRQAAEAFLEEIAPFVWRKYLDFAAIMDIQSMKARIDEHRGFDDIAVAGHNVKLGRGGIREVEFFVQAQQLIAGGRAPQLRQRRTDRALEELAEGGWITAATRDELTADYWFLRRVEHAIQMVADEQSHTLPEDEEGLERIARLAGLKDRSAFAEALVEHLKRVDRHYGGLFKERDEEAKAEDPQAALAGLLNAEDDSEGVARLKALGFARPGDVARIVRGWSFGRYRCDALRRGPCASRPRPANAPQGVLAGAGSGRGDRDLRHLPRRPAGGHPVLLADRLQPAHPRPSGARHHLGPGAARDDRGAPACLRRAARPGVLRRDSGPAT